MRRPIAMIRISAGNPGWYDSLTNIHLTITRPTAYVYEGSNTTNIKNAVRHGSVFVIEGDLDCDSVVLAETKEQEVVKEVREVAPQVEEKTEEVVTDDVIPTKDVQEEIQEAPEVIEVAKEVAKVVEEKPKAKRTTRKKATKTETEETK